MDRTAESLREDQVPKARKKDNLNSGWPRVPEGLPKVPEEQTELLLGRKAGMRTDG